MARLVNITNARKDLPKLFDRVTAHDGVKVIIRRRDGGREAVLVSRDYLEGLEKKHAEPAAPKNKRWSLSGSMKLTMPVEDIIAEIRANDDREFEKRLNEFAPLPKPRRR